MGQEQEHQGQNYQDIIEKEMEAYYERLKALVQSPAKPHMNLLAEQCLCIFGLTQTINFGIVKLCNALENIAINTGALHEFGKDFQEFKKQLTRIADCCCSQLDFDEDEEFYDEETDVEDASSNESSGGEGAEDTEEGEEFSEDFDEDLGEDDGENEEDELEENGEKNDDEDSF